MISPSTLSDNEPAAPTPPGDGGPLLIGLTGGIGSGKTTVANHFEALGATVVDTDALAHELTAPGGAAIAAIRDAFGDQVIADDGRLDRAAMRQIAFEDSAARKQLESILHPMIGALSKERIAAARSAYVILAIPLLVESGRWRERVHHVLVIDCAEQTQIDRVIKRSGLDEAQIRAIMAAQASRQQRLAAADDIIDNDGPEDALTTAVQKLHEKFLLLAAKRTNDSPSP